MRSVIRYFQPFLSGLLFGAGLLVSGMTSPTKVQGFLDIGGRWDPSLAMVMGGAVCVALPLFQWILRHERKRRPHGLIDGRLIVGSVLFGVGWGLSGYCPGPALVVAGTGSLSAMQYVLAMAVGMLVASRFGATEASKAGVSFK